MSLGLGVHFPERFKIFSVVVTFSRKQWSTGDSHYLCMNKYKNDVGRHFLIQNCSSNFQSKGKRRCI